jgi:hypothetical protein
MSASRLMRAVEIAVCAGGAVGGAVGGVSGLWVGHHLRREYVAGLPHMESSYATLVIDRVTDAAVVGGAGGVGAVMGTALGAAAVATAPIWITHQAACRLSR